MESFCLALGIKRVQFPFVHTRGPQSPLLTSLQLGHPGYPKLNKLYFICSLMYLTGAAVRDPITLKQGFCSPCKQLGLWLGCCTVQITHSRIWLVRELQVPRNKRNHKPAIFVYLFHSVSLPADCFPYGYISLALQTQTKSTVIYSNVYVEQDSQDCEFWISTLFSVMKFVRASSTFQKWMRGRVQIFQSFWRTNRIEYTYLKCCRNVKAFPLFPFLNSQGKKNLRFFLKLHPSPSRCLASNWLFLQCKYALNIPGYQSAIQGLKCLPIDIYLFIQKKKNGAG